MFGGRYRASGRKDVRGREEGGVVGWEDGVGRERGEWCAGLRA